MKKDYLTPELKILEFNLKDVILTSPTEATIPEIIGGGEGGGDDVISGLDGL